MAQTARYVGMVFFIFLNEKLMQLIILIHYFFPFGGYSNVYLFFRLILWHDNT